MTIGHIRKDRLINEVIREKIGFASIKYKMMGNRLRWFAYVRQRRIDAPVRRPEGSRTDKNVMGQGRPRKTWINDKCD